MSEREILDQLVKAGKITEGDINKIMTPAKRKLVEIVHLLMCTKDHDKSECSWYIEEQMDGTWKGPDHLQWIEKADDILRGSNMTIEEAISGFDYIRTVLKDAGMDGCLELLRFVLSSNPTKLIPESNTKNSTGSSDDSSLSG